MRVRACVYVFRTQGFNFVTHKDLTAFIRRELTSNNGFYGARRVWRRTNCIPVGGSFSAQRADLIRSWVRTENRKWFYGLGRLVISAEGCPPWHTPLGSVTMCHEARHRHNTALPTGSSTSVPCSLCTIVIYIFKCISTLFQHSKSPNGLHQRVRQPQNRVYSLNIHHTIFLPIMGIAPIQHNFNLMLYHYTN